MPHKFKAPELWWVIADEPTGKMSYLKAECKNAVDAAVMVRELLKENSKLRYRVIKIY